MFVDLVGFAVLVFPNHPCNLRGLAYHRSGFLMKIEHNWDLTTNSGNPTSVSIYLLCVCI